METQADQDLERSSSQRDWVINRTGRPMDCTDFTSVINRYRKQCIEVHTPPKIKTNWRYHWFWQWFESSRSPCKGRSGSISELNNSTYVVNGSTSASISSLLEETSLRFLSNPCFDWKLGQDAVRCGNTDVGSHQISPCLLLVILRLELINLEKALEPVPDDWPTVTNSWDGSHPR